MCFLFCFVFCFCFNIVFCPQVTCGWRDVKIQELRRGRGHSKCGLWTWHEHDRLLVTASALNTADAEEYRRTMTHWTVHTLNATDTFQITPWHSTPRGNFTPPFHTIALLHTIPHHFTLCSPSRPQTLLQTLNPTGNWILDWTLPTLNNSKQTMNAVDCNPANTIDYVCYRLYL